MERFSWEQFAADVLNSLARQLGAVDDDAAARVAQPPPPTPVATSPVDRYIGLGVLALVGLAALSLLRR